MVNSSLQQLREAIGFDDQYEYLLHDRDRIFANHLDESIERIGVKVLRSRPRSPKSNAVCERVIGTIRRECLDRVIPVSEHHLRRMLKSWVRHYNGGRPHMSLALEFPMRLQSRHSRRPHRDIVAENRIPLEPHQSWVDCITNTL